MNLDRIAVVGAGAFGTALAQLAAGHGGETLLWARNADLAAAINREHENADYLPGQKLDPAIRATSDLAEIAGSDCWLMVTPAQVMRSVLECAPRAPRPLILCAKGIEQTSGKLLNAVAEEVTPGSTIGVLSGPSFADEVAAGLPTAVTFASTHEPFCEAVQARLAGPTFRIYCTDDVIGAEVGGAVKNVLAIACGVVDGKGLGDSARAALIARGYAEMSRFAEAAGARRETLSGLCGLGDLVLTCSSTTSRNFSLGVGLGEGRSAAELLADRHTVAEGAFTAPVLARLARENGIEMPIVDAVDALVAGRATVDEVLEALLSRPPRAEAV
jgi:glycerol-3-phosphate dehydrogenase (NAD(P)+)